MDFDPSDDSFTCTNSSPSCERFHCEANKQHASAILALLAANPLSSPTVTGLGDCPKPVGGSMKDTCCLADLKMYDGDAVIDACPDKAALFF